MEKSLISNNKKWYHRLINQPLALLLMIIIILIIIFVTIAWYEENIGPGEYAVSIGTLILALTAFLSVLEQRYVTNLQFRPLVIASFEIDWINGNIYFLIANVGGGTAKDIKLKIEPMLVDSIGRSFEKTSLIEDGIQILPATSKKSIPLGHAVQYCQSSRVNPLKYSISISYTDESGYQYERHFSEDLTIYEMAHFPPIRNINLTTDDETPSF